MSNLIIEPKEIISGSGISFKSDSVEMLRIERDAFYVRGEKIEIDEKEASTVYTAFSSWLSWVNLQRGY